MEVEVQLVLVRISEFQQMTSAHYNPNYSTFCTSERTKYVKNYANETVARPRSSNFIAHADNCRLMPKDQRYSAWLERQTSSSSISVVSKEGDEMRQRGMIAEFVKCGRENPQKEVTQRGFRQHFVKGVIQDDLPYSFGEKRGMWMCFKYILPKGYSVPYGDLVRRDLNILYTKLEEKLSNMIQVRILCHILCSFYCLCGWMVPQCRLIPRLLQSQATSGPARTVYLPLQACQCSGLMINGG